MDAEADMKASLLPRRPLTSATDTCHDLWAALLFLANVAFIGYSAAVTDANAAVFDRQIGLLLLVFAALGVVALVMSSLWLACITRYSSSLIEFMLYATAVVFSLLAVGSLLSGAVLGALLMALAAGASYWYLQMVRPRMPFASAVLRIAVRSISAHYLAMMAVSVVVSGFALVWLGTWSVATFKFLSGFGGEESNSYLEWAELFLYLVSLHWGCQLFKAVLSATVCGTLAYWWYEPANRQPVLLSLWRSVSWCFGSLCFGSLVVSVLQALRDLLRLIRAGINKREGRERRDGDELATCLKVCLLFAVESVLSFFESIMSYLNKYAFCYVAAYGHSFVESGRQVIRLFTDKGWLGIINDDLISNVLFLGILLCTVVNALVGVLFAAIFYSTLSLGIDNSQAAFALIGGAAGAVVGFIISNIIDSGVSMVFVCFAEGEHVLMVRCFCYYCFLINVEKPP